MKITASRALSHARWAVWNPNNGIVTGTFLLREDAEAHLRHIQDEEGPYRVVEVAA